MVWDEWPLTWDETNFRWDEEWEFSNVPYPLVLPWAASARRTAAPGTLTLAVTLEMPTAAALRLAGRDP